MDKNQSRDIHEKKSNIFTEYVFNQLYDVINGKENILAPSNPHNITPEEREKYLKFKNVFLSIYPRNLMVVATCLTLYIFIAIFGKLREEYSVENFGLIWGLIGGDIALITTFFVLQGKLNHYEKNRHKL